MSLVSDSSNLQIVGFAVLIIVFVFVCMGTVALCAHRRRISALATRARLASRSQPCSTTSPTRPPTAQLDARPAVLSASVCQCESDLEKGDVPTELADATSSADVSEISQGSALPRPLGFLWRWKRRVLDESDSVPELAVLPSYHPRRSALRRALNLVLGKKHAKPEPPTVGTVTRAIEEAEATRGANASKAKKANKSKGFQIPEIVIQYCDGGARGLVGPGCALSRSSSSSSSGSGSTHSSSSLGSIPTSPSCPKLDFLHLPPPPPSLNGPHEDAASGAFNLPDSPPRSTVDSPRCPEIGASQERDVEGQTSVPGVSETGPTGLQVSGLQGGPERTLIRTSSQDVLRAYEPPPNPKTLASSSISSSLVDVILQAIAIGSSDEDLPHTSSDTTMTISGSDSDVDSDSSVEMAKTSRSLPARNAGEDESDFLDDVLNAYYLRLSIITGNDEEEEEPEDGDSDSAAADVTSGSRCIADGHARSGSEWGVGPCVASDVAPVPVGSGRYRVRFRTPIVATMR